MGGHSCSSATVRVSRHLLRLRLRNCCCPVLLLRALPTTMSGALAYLAHGDPQTVRSSHAEGGHASPARYWHSCLSQCAASLGSCAAVCNNRCRLFNSYLHCCFVGGQHATVRVQLWSNQITAHNCRMHTFAHALMQRSCLTVLQDSCVFQCRFYIVDMMPYVYKALLSTANTHTAAEDNHQQQFYAADGQPGKEGRQGATAQVVATILDLIRRKQDPPSHMAVVVDVPGPTFR